ncbi:hypothetical protein [Algoriphagus chordae]|nr:hypothetical protein [Algoriphagus chordae]
MSIKCNEFRELLSNAPLYKKSKISSAFASNPQNLHDFGFPFECLCNPEPQTHLLKLDEESIRRMVDASPFDHNSALSGKPRNRAYGEYQLGSEVGQRFIEKLTGECQNCKRSNPIFLIDFFTELVEGKNEYFFYAKKIGQNPPFSIKPETFVSKLLSTENLDFYKKA